MLDKEFMHDVVSGTVRWGYENHLAGGVCDFCVHPIDTATVTTYVIDAPIVEVQTFLDVKTLAAGSLTHNLDEFWAACPACDPVIAAGDARALAEHAVRNRNVARTFPVGTEAQEQGRIENVLGLYEKFFAGQPRRVQGGDE